MNQLEMRRSIRKYLERPVEDEKIRQLLESARLAPSGSNTQPWHFVVVKDPSIRGKLAEASHKQTWIVSYRKSIKINIELFYGKNNFLSRRYALITSLN